MKSGCMEFELLKLPTDEIRIVVPGKDPGRRRTGPFVKDEDAARGTRAVEIRARSAGQGTR